MSPSVNRRATTLAVLCAMALMIVLDSTIVAVAMPDIQRDLGFSPAGVAWVVNAYLVAFAGLLLLAGRLGDLIGSRRVFLAGLALFTVASLLCGLARTPAMLVAGRFVQGAGGALASAVILGMIVRLFPEPAAQARAMGVYSFTQAGGAAIGLVAGGLLTDAVGWPAIFLTNVPIGLAVWLLGRRLLPREAGLGLRAGLDVPGALLITAGLSLGVYAIVRAGSPGAGTPLITAPIAVAAAPLAVAAAPLAGAGAILLILGFLLRQRLARRPLIPLRLLGRRWLLAANAAMIPLFAAGMGFQFVNALFMQRVMGYDALRTGLAFLPTPIVIGLVSLFAAPRLTGRYGPRPVLIAGLSALAAGLLLLSRLPADPSYLTQMLPPLIVMGLGVGVAVPAVIMLAMAGAAPSDTGMVSGLGSTSQQAGAALGVAVLIAVAAAQTESRSAAGAPLTTALRDGYSRSFLLAAAFILTSLLLTAFLLRRLPAPPAVSAAPEPAGSVSAAPESVALDHLGHFSAICPEPGHETA